MPQNAHKAKEFSRECVWIADAYAAALVFLWLFIWRYNHRVFPIQHRRWTVRSCADAAEDDADQLGESRLIANG